MKRLLVFLSLLVLCVSAYSASTSLWVGESHTFNIKKDYNYTISYCDYWMDVTFSNSSPENVSITYSVPPMDGTIELTVKVLRYFTGSETITMNYTRVYGMPNSPFYEKKSKTYTVSCKKAYINLEPDSVVLEIGQTKQLSYSFSSDGTPNPAVSLSSFSTSNSGVAKVSSSGLVTAVGVGQATITAKTNYNTTDECVVTVPAIMATGISLDKSSMMLLTGSTRSLSATVTPSNATNKGVKWTSSDPDVLSVDTKGNIKALKPGVATITAATADGTNLNDSCEVTIYNGDVNGDKIIDVADVDAIIDMILGIIKK